MKNQIILLVIFSSCLFRLPAQDSTRIALDSILHHIETNYPLILQFRHNIQSWQAKAQASKSWMPPSVSTGVMRFPYDLSMVTDKNNPMNQAGIVFSIEQMIPSQTKNHAKYDYFNSLAEVEISKSNWTLNQLRKEAKILYYSRFINEQKRKIISESEAVLNLAFSTAEAKFSSNGTELQTLYKAKARMAELKNMQYMLSALIEENNIGLNSFMLRDVYTNFDIDTIIQPRNYSDTNPDTTNIANRSDITALTRYIQSMKLEQKAMRVEVRPDFGIRAEHMQMFGMPNQWSVMGMMTIPIAPWSSKMYSSGVKSMGFQIQSMELEKQTMELMATKMLTEKLAMIKFENMQYQNYKQQILPAYENNLKINLLAFRQNTGDLFILLDAWEMLLMKKLEAFDKLFNILKLEAEYEYELEIK